MLHPITQLAKKYGIDTVKKPYSEVEQELIDAMMRRLEGRSITRQLQYRKIVCFHVKDQRRNRRVAYLNPMKTGFHITLEKTQKEGWCEDLGHEIAHTFFYNLDARPWPDELFSTPNSPYGKNRLETFCDKFGKRWEEQYRDRFNALLEELGFTQKGLNMLLNL